MAMEEAVTATKLPGDDERLRRWRLLLGGDADGTGCALHGVDLAIDGALGALYDRGGDPQRDRDPARTVGMGPTQLNVTRWLGDIRTYFPSSVVRVMQKDAMERLNLRQMLLQ